MAKKKKTGIISARSGCQIVVASIESMGLFVVQVYIEQGNQYTYQRKPAL